MDAKLILIVVAVGVFCFALGALVSRSRRRDGQMLMRPTMPVSPAVQPSPSPTSALAASVAAGEAIDERLRQFIREGKTIEAIKLYRARTGSSLKDAKDAVEAEIDRMHAAGR